MSELKEFESERIYWAVEQVERVAGDIDELHLDDNSFYLKSEVDEAIAELKAKLESVQASAYADSVDAGMRERRLKRALWLERADRAKDKQEYENVCRLDGWVHRQNEWLEVERKCLNKAEEYR